MYRFARGERVRIDIPNETHPYYELHSEHGVIIEIDDNNSIIGVGLEDLYITFDAYPWELRPPIE